jgi:hypothetical protein
VLPLRDVVVYPHMVIPLFVGRDRSIKALDIAMAADKKTAALIVAAVNAFTTSPSAISEAPTSADAGEPYGYICTGCDRFAIDPAADLEEIRAGKGNSCCHERDVQPLYLHPSTSPSAIDEAPTSAATAWMWKGHEFAAAQRLTFFKPGNHQADGEPIPLYAREAPGAAGVTPNNSEPSP